MTAQAQPTNLHARTDPARLRVLMTSTSYPSGKQDWKGLFIRNLVEAMARRKDVDLDLWAPSGVVPGNVASALQAGDAAWLESLSRKGGIAHVIRKSPIKGVLPAAGLLRRLRRAYALQKSVDVFHINWLQNALPLPSGQTPVLLTALGTDMRLLDLPLVKPGLRRVMSNRPAVICPNAEWMIGPLEAAFGEVARIQYNPFGISPEWFLLERQLPATPRWLAVIRLTRDKIGPLLEWGEALFADGSRELHMIGPMQGAVVLPDWAHYHGPATPEELHTKWFPSATGLVSLSQHAEGRPQVMLEAMASGLPVLASQLPAHADLLAHQDTGWLCDSAATFCQGVVALENEQVNLCIGLAARARVLQEFGTWDDCAQRYMDIYRDLAQQEHR